MPLYIVATPIGNLHDMTPRAVETLQRAEVILCENPRHSQKLFFHYGVGQQVQGKGLEKTSGQSTARKIIQLNEHNEKKLTPGIIKQLQNNQHVALISDAGTPLISDPGFFLIRQAREAGIKIIPIPGASSILTALCASGLPANHFTFFGFPPIKQQARHDMWEKSNQAEVGTAVFFLPPHKAKSYLDELANLHPERLACLAREMTKIHEEYITLPLAQLFAHCMAANNWRGEMVLVLAPTLLSVSTTNETAVGSELLTLYYKNDWPMKKAIDKTIALTGLGKKLLYNMALNIWDKK